MRIFLFIFVCFLLVSCSKEGSDQCKCTFGRWNAGHPAYSTYWEIHDKERKFYKQFRYEDCPEVRERLNNELETATLSVVSCEDLY